MKAVRSRLLLVVAVVFVLGTCHGASLIDGDFFDLSTFGAPSARYLAQSGSKGDYLFVHGGVAAVEYGSNSKTTLSDEFWSFDSNKDTWTLVDHFPSSLGAAAAVVGDFFVTFGGKDVSDVFNNGLTLYHIKSEEVITPAVDENAPDPRWGHCATASNKRKSDDDEDLFVFGGQLENGDLANDLWAYNPTKDSWDLLDNKGKSSPKARMWSSIVFQYDPLEEKEFLYLFGGVDANDNALSDLWQYDIVDEKWTIISQSSARDVEAGEFPRARSRIQLSVLQGRYLTIVGGISDTNDILADVWLFDLTLYSVFEDFVTFSEDTSVPSSPQTSASTDIFDIPRSLLSQNPWTYVAYPQVPKRLSDYVCFSRSSNLFIFGGLDRSGGLSFFTRIFAFPFGDSSNSSNSPNSSNSSGASSITFSLFSIVFLLSCLL